jgi:hypothetical protein
LNEKFARDSNFDRSAFHMVLGCLVSISQGIRSDLPRHSVTVTGVQTGFIVSFTIIQRFTNPSANSADIAYLVPSNSKICIYETTFRLRDEVIKPRLERKAVADVIFREAAREGRTAILGQHIGQGLVEFRLGNLPPNDFCEVEVCCAFVSSSAGPNELSFKFPLDTCTRGGDTRCITSDLSGGFKFSLRNARPDAVSEISSNVAGVFNPGECTYTISEATKVPALFIQTTLKSELSSLSVCAGNFLSLTVFLPESPPTEAETEFVFVVDCSGSMSGNRIQQARFCLDLFIRSLPPNSYFNVVRFGSEHKSLWHGSHPYNQESVDSALNLAKWMHADLGGTDLLRPLKSVCHHSVKGAGARQVFVITDGEVENTSAVIDLARKYADKNRIFAIGIGSGADARLVEGIADVTGGRAVFTATSDDLSEMVISQLELSLQPGLTQAALNVADHDAIEITPFPIRPIFPGVASSLFVRGSTPFDGEPQLLLTGDFGNDPAEFVIEGECDPSLERCLMALFAFASLNAFERGAQGNQEVIDRCVALSIESGVLCSHTAFVGFSEGIHRTQKSDQELDWNMIQYDSSVSAAPPPPPIGYWSDDYEEPPPPVGSCGDDYGAAPPPPPLPPMGYWSDGYRAPLPPPPPPPAGSCGDDYDPPPPPAGFGAAPPSPSSAAPLPPPEPRSVPQSRPSPAPAAPRGDLNLCRQVISQQDLGGWWPEPDRLLVLVHTTLPDFLVAELSGSGKRNEFIATVVALAILRKKCGKEQGIWKLIERKAVNWLRSQGVEYEGLLKRVMASLVD